MQALSWKGIHFFGMFIRLSHSSFHLGLKLFYRYLVSYIPPNFIPAPVISLHLTISLPVHPFLYFTLELPVCITNRSKVFREVFLPWENNETNSKLTYIKPPNYIIMGERQSVCVLKCRMSLKSEAVCWTKIVTKFSQFPCTSYQRLWRGLLPLRAHSVKHTWKPMLRVRFGSNCEPCVPDYTHTRLLCCFFDHVTELKVCKMRKQAGCSEKCHSFVLTELKEFHWTSW